MFVEASVVAREQAGGQSAMIWAGLAPADPSRSRSGDWIFRCNGSHWRDVRRNMIQFMFVNGLARPRLCLRKGAREEQRGGRCRHPGEGPVVAWIKVMAAEEPRSGYLPSILAVESTGIASGLDLCKVRGFLGFGFE